MELTKEVIVWILVVIGTNLSAVILAVLSWIKAAKMIPREIKGSDLDNRSKEVSIADQLDELATRAADKAIKSQERLDKLESDYDLLKDKVQTQDDIIKDQADIINKQSIRLDLQEKKIMEQEEEITLLKCELNNAQLYNQALISQMREKSIIPIELESISPEDCQHKLDERNKSKITRKTKKE